jgi:hypothetical protein
MDDRLLSAEQGQITSTSQRRTLTQVGYRPYRRGGSVTPVTRGADALVSQPVDPARREVDRAPSMIQALPLRNGATCVTGQPA